MMEEEIQAALASLHQQSRTSLVLVLLGGGFLTFSVFYSISRLAPLEREIQAKRQEIARLAAAENVQRKRLEAAQAAFDTLRTSTESLYAVRVTPFNQVYELRATAIATGRTLSGGDPEYRFSIFINSPRQTLDTIERVTYHMEHSTFKQKDYASSDPASRFAAGYTGWGCLSSVKVVVLLKSGVAQQQDFNMCRSLGPAWQ